MNFNSKRKLQKDVSKALKSGKLHKSARNLLVTTIAAGSVLGGLAFASNVNPSVTTSVVEAKTAKKKAVKAKSVVIKKTSAVYNKKGKKTGSTIKKGKLVKVYGTKTIKGKKYYKLGKGRYILVKNVIAATTITLKKNSYIYNGKGKRVGKKVLKKSKRIKTYGTKIIKGKKYYYLGNGKYVVAANVETAVVPTTPTEPTKPTAPSNGGSTGSSSTPTPAPVVTAKDITVNFKTLDDKDATITDPDGKAVAINGEVKSDGHQVGESVDNKIFDSMIKVNSMGQYRLATATELGSKKQGFENLKFKDSLQTITVYVVKNSSVASTSAASVASAVRPGMTEIYHGLSDLSSKLKDPKYQAIKNDIKDVLAKIKALPTTWTNTSDMISKVTPILNEALDIAKKLEGAGVKTDLVNVLHGLEKVDQQLDPGQIQNLKNVYAALENIDAGTSRVRKDIKELAQGLHPDLSNIYHDLEAIKSEVSPADYQSIKNDIKVIISATKELPSNFDWSKLNEIDHIGDDDVQSVLGNFSTIYTATKDIANKLQGKGVKTNLEKLLADTAHINTTLKADESKLFNDLKDLDDCLENYSGTDETINKAKGLAKLTHADLVNIYHALDALTTAQIDTAAINTAINDALGNIENLPDSNTFLNDVAMAHLTGQNCSEIDAIKAIYKDLRAVASNLEGKGIKTQLVNILHSLEDLNQKVAQDPAQIQNLKDIYNSLQNGDFTWLNNLK
ncbi:SLAP domain-containing protein [Lactobacillus sp. ESL0731]|uniref:SLAP domain-containing protein n=1 Tax=unclassified Lactobacillus TaxID=2620435 RepID=UPI0023F84CC0|nr:MULTISPECIES: SLAP domain-containing protein [unclassified Lactobacillus]WEV50970.1 SLAP domain-containing protein [Lactobacillus sp. ESL0700]WEV62101.1 SLAP domain-containing protein [Lactobacillus sp. ESL0731]